MHITLNVLANYDLFDVDTCDVGYNIEKKKKKTTTKNKLRMFVRSSTNALLNNFCSWENDIIS